MNAADISPRIAWQQAIVTALAAWISLGVSCFNISGALVFYLWAIASRALYIRLAILQWRGNSHCDCVRFTILRFHTNAGTKVWIIAIVFDLLRAFYNLFSRRRAYVRNSRDAHTDQDRARGSRIGRAARGTISKLQHNFFSPREP